MWVEMTCLVLGVPVGFMLRKKPLIIKLTDQMLTWSVRVLLLLLGLALGADERLMSQMDTIGARGIFISLCCVLGSLVGARLIEPVMNRHVGAPPPPSKARAAHEENAASGEGAKENSPEGK